MTCIAVMFFAAALTQAPQPCVENAAFEEFDAGGAPVGWRLPKSGFHAAKGEGMNGSGGLVWENDDPTCYICASQPLALEAGKEYRFGAHVKVDSQKTPGGQKDGAFACIEWYDAKGKWMGGAYSTRAKGSESDWNRIEAVTARIPEGAATFSLHLFGGKKCVGRVRFDNVFVQPYVRSAVTGVYSDAYRDIVAEGDVAFHAVLNPPDGGWPKGLKAEFSFLGADGTKAVVPAATLKDDEAAVTVPAERLAKGTHKVVFTLSGADGGVLGESSLDFARVDELPPRAAYVDRHQRLVVDGKPFFPLGMYWGEITAERLDIYTNAPFNCLMPYAWPTRAQLDLCAARGLKSFANIKSFRNRDLEKRIKALMDHPALMAWYVIDEAPLADLDSYVSLYRTLRKADSQHPAWAVMDRLDDIRDFLPTCDIMGFDPYPVAQRPIGLVAERARDGRAAIFNTKPVWIVPQAFDWSWYRPHQSDRERLPTLEEMRSMTWQGIVEGARGIVFYSFHGMFKYADKATRDELWGNVVEVVREVKRFEDVLLSVEPAPEVVGAPPGLSVRTWRCGDSVYLLAVNTTREPLSAEVGLPGATGVAAMELGVGASVPSAGRVRVELPPIGLSMTRLSAAALPATARTEGLR